MYSNILIPVVFDEGHNTDASFDAARALANDDAKFTVLHVMEAIPAFVAAQIPYDMLAKSRDDAMARAEDLAGQLPNAVAEVVSGHAGVNATEVSNAG